MEPQAAAQAAGVAQLPGLLAPGRVARRPSTLQMVKEALQAQDEKGASVFTIKQFILAKYPTEDPIRLKYLLKQALSKGLSRGELVRPHNSSAVGATGTFMLAPEQPRHKQHPGRAKPDRGQSLEPGQKRTTTASSAPMAGAQRRGTATQQLGKQKPKAKAVDAQPRAAEKPRSDGAKPPRAAGRAQAPGRGNTGPPRAAAQPQAPSPGHSGPHGAAAADGAGAGKGDSSAEAGAKGAHKVQGGQSKGKVLQGARQDGPKPQQDGPKARRRRGRAPKPQGRAGAGQGEAGPWRAAPHPGDTEGL